jgi:hypothetical protein
MKTAVAITLIICGVVVIAIPALWHAWDSLMVSVTMTHLTQPGSSVNFGEAPELYQLACWMLGAAMIGVSVVSSIIQSNARPSAHLAVGAG